MKTKEEIQDEIISCEEEIRLIEGVGGSGVRKRRQLVILRSCLLAHEKIVSEDLLRKDLLTVQKKLSVLTEKELFDAWKEVCQEAKEIRNHAKLKNMYESEMGIKKMRKQITMLKYLLK